MSQRLTTLLTALSLLSALVSSPARADEVDTLVAALHRNLSAWDTAAVSDQIDALRARHPEHQGICVVEARLRLMQRDFEGAQRVLGARCEGASDRGLRSLCDVIEGSRRVTRDFKTLTTEPGHFVLHYLPGPDEVLVPYAAETLEAAYERLGGHFRYFPAGPVHVDFLPQIEDLAAMTPLSREEIETSGTIAMCKYDRMMVVSPRDLVYGYSWRDTLAHEYIHFLLTRRSGNQVPLWLHEGLAKYHEVLWREGAEPSLAPIAEHVLADAIRRKRLISLDKLHPSIAKLPSQEAVALAFAEVHTVVRWMRSQDDAGRPLDELLDRLRDGEKLDEALEGSFGRSFRQVRRAWRRWLGRQDFDRIPRAVRPRKLFRSSDRKEDELASIEEEEGRDFTYLGDLLRARGKPEAALREFDKAVAVVGSTSPVVQSKVAAALLDLGRHEAVLDAVESVLLSYPSHVLLHLYEGEALLRLGRIQEAAAALERALGLNPFDSKVHVLLSECYDKLGRERDAAFERRQHALVAAE